MNEYTQTAASMMREAAKNNCKEICKLLGQDESLYMEKFKRFVRDIKNPEYLAPMEMYRRVYNSSVQKLSSLKERVQAQ